MNVSTSRSAKILGHPDHRLSVLPKLPVTCVPVIPSLQDEANPLDRSHG